MTTEFKKGDIVCHKAKFLRDIGWFTNVPINAKVLAVDEDLVTVQWNDRDEPNRIHRGNLILFAERHLEPA